jgi:hypothetical protein
MKFFRWYQFVGPLIFLPLGYSLWFGRYDGNHALAALALSVPIVFAYVVPGLGMNVFKLWEVNTRFRVGRFRPHHGFVFGTATSLFGLVCVPPGANDPGVAAYACAALVTGSVLGFWNWLYDTYAIKAGFIVIHNRLAAEGQPAEVVATDHAPVLFGSFGAVYGLVLQRVEGLGTSPSPPSYWTLLMIGNVAGIVVPVLAYVASSYLKHGDSGLKVGQRSVSEGVLL